MQQTLKFQSTVSVFLVYLVLKAAPISAVVYYFYNWQASLLTAVLTLVIILIYAGRSNHDFSLSSTELIIQPSIFIWRPTQYIPYVNIQGIEVKYSAGRDNRQWLLVHYEDRQNNRISKKYRCDWLHMQDPPDDEEHHDEPEHELFELLEDEDFYNGSLEHLSNELRDRGLRIKDMI